jgi:RimJ/RimL family protein N-acetyltransferase
MPFLRGQLVALHPETLADGPFVTSLLNDPEVRAGIGHSTPLVPEDHKEIRTDDDDSESHFLIRVDGEPVGSCSLHEDDHRWGVAEVGYAVHPDHWNEGYATDAVDCLARYAFEERRINKLGADVYATNPASARVLENVGFQREGTRREHAFVEGEYVDLHEYGLLADEWRG